METFTAEANLNLRSQSSQTKPNKESNDQNMTPIDDDSTTPNIINLALNAKFIAKSGIIKLYPKSYFTKNHSRKSTSSSSKVHERMRLSSHGSHGSMATPPWLNLDGIDLYSESNLDDTSRKGVDTIIIPGLSLNIVYQSYWSNNWKR